MAVRVTPTRTCVGCRVRGPKPELIRVVVVGAECVPDLLGRLPGRGAYVHPDPACVELAERRRAFPRALRAPGPLECGAVRREVEGRQQVYAAGAVHAPGSPVRKQVEKR